MKAGVLVLILALTCGAFAEEHSHSHEGHNTQMVLNEGKKWQSDQTLKVNMAALEEKFDSVHKLFETKKVKSSDYKMLAKQIGDSTSQIVKNCKLEPKADATLHVVLGKLLAAQENLKNPKKRIVALREIHESLNLYHEYFE